MSGTIPATADVVIVGGGIMGTSLTWSLARRGAGRVVLLERGTVASGASGRTGALLRRHYSNPWEASLAHLSWETFANWPDVVGGKPVHIPTPLVVTVDMGPGNEANIDLMRRNIALQNGIGIKTRMVTAAELVELQPYANADDLVYAAYEADSGYVDAPAAVRSMAVAAQRQGAVVREQSTALELLTDGSRIRGVRTPEGDIFAGTVVVAAGASSVRLMATAGVTAPVSALRVQVAILHRPLAMAADHAVYVDSAAGIFCRPAGPGRTLIGLGGGDQHDEVDPEDYRAQNDPGYPAAVIAAGARRMPGLAHATYLNGHACLYDMTPDTHPIISPAGPEGLYLCAGFSGAGFKKGPAVGESLASLIIAGHGDPVDLAKFSLSRFESDAWQEPWSETEYVFTHDFGHKF